MSTITRSQGIADYVIDIANVAKTYKGKVRALQGIEMRVHGREVFGLLGPNGAGKSTLVKILMTVIRPTTCEGRMLGRPVGHKETLGRVGYLPEHHRFPDYLTAAQVLDFVGAMTKTPRKERRARAGGLLDLVGMTDWADKPIKSFSKGMRQRLGIAQALINDPDLVLLDEPTDGVDPVGRRDIRTAVMRLKDEGKTVFINSHLLNELEMVCDRVAILVKGRVARQGTIDELTANQRRYEIEVANTDAPAMLESALPEARWGARRSLSPPTSSPLVPRNAAEESELASRIAITGELASGLGVSIERNTLRVNTDQPEVVQPILDAIRARGGVIKAVRPHRPSLEDLFMEAVTDAQTGKALTPGAEKGKQR